MTQACLPQQDVSAGHPGIVVSEGQVSKRAVEDGDTHCLSPGNGAPCVEGSARNLSDIEQALDQINRPASNNATVDTLTGTAPGDTRLVLRNAPTTRRQA